MERPHSARHSSCLPIQLFGVELHSFLPLLPPTPRAQPRLPRQVRRRSRKKPFPTYSLRSAPAPPSASSLRLLFAHPVSARLGGLPQTALRWSTACLTLPGRLHPPCRHFQSSLSDSILARVPTSFLAPRSSPGIRPHSF